MSWGTHKSNPNAKDHEIAKQGKHWSRDDKTDGGHSTTIKYEDGSVKYYEHQPNNATPNGWLYN